LKKRKKLPKKKKKSKNKLQAEEEEAIQDCSLEDLQEMKQMTKQEKYLVNMEKSKMLEF